MNEIYFQVTIAHKKNIPLSLDEIREFPTHKMYMCEYEQKIINVMYKPAKGFGFVNFINFMKKKLMKEFNTSEVIYLEKQTLIN